MRRGLHPRLLPATTLQTVASEIYDHQNDPDENVNIAVDKANADLLKQLTQQWRDGWRKALSPGN